MIAISYGGGVNSQGLLALAWQRGIRPDAILYADTGSEMPQTGRTVEGTSAWLAARDWPPITVVRWIRQDGRFLALHEWCLAHRQLPSLAYGLRGCSVKWKRQPIEHAIKADSLAVAEWAAGRKVERWVGIDAGEAHRVGGSGDEHLYHWRRPLVDARWGREECLEEATRIGLPVAAKSSCWCCPAMRRREILDLRDRHPDLFAAAVEMEHAAAETTTAVHGLGRAWSWEEVVRADAAQCRLFAPSVPCECWESEPGEDAA